MYKSRRSTCGERFCRNACNFRTFACRPSCSDFFRIWHHPCYGWCGEPTCRSDRPGRGERLPGRDLGGGSANSITGCTGRGERLPVVRWLFFISARHRGPSALEPYQFPARRGILPPSFFPSELSHDRGPHSPRRGTGRASPGSLLAQRKKDPPRKGPEPPATDPATMKVAKGFKVELLYSVPKDEQGSWVNMCVDPKGRLIVSDQYGALYRVTPPPVGGKPARRRSRRSRRRSARPRGCSGRSTPVRRRQRAREGQEISACTA